MPHVDEGTLHALLDGALRAEDPERAEGVRLHLARCEDCRARLAAAAELQGGARAILEDAAPANPDPVPDFGDVLARAGASRRKAAGGAAAGAGGSSPSRLQRQNRWVRGVAWAASLVVALGTGYLLRDLAGPTPPAVPSAMMQPRAADTEDAAAEPALDVGDGGREGEGDAAPTSATDLSSVRAEAVAPTPAPGAGAGRAQQAAERSGTTGDVTVESPALQQGMLTPAPTPAGTGGARASAQGIARESASERMELVRESARDASARDATLRGEEAAPAPVFAPAAASAPTPELEPEAYRWSAATLTEARSALDGPVYVLPRASMDELYLSADTTAPRVMSRQRLESGLTVEVVQWRGGAGARAGALNSVSDEAADPEQQERPELPGLEVAQVVRGPYMLQVTGPLPEELLSILADSAVPAP